MGKFHPSVRFLDNYMHDRYLQDQFVELRAQGISFGRIAGKLGVPKATLVLWSQQRQLDIQSARAAMENPDPHAAILAATYNRTDQALR